jgi:hypothetical protein
MSNGMFVDAIGHHGRDRKSHLISFKSEDHLRSSELRSHALFGLFTRITKYIDAPWAMDSRIWPIIFPSSIRYKYSSVALQD